MFELQGVRMSEGTSDQLIEEALGWLEKCRWSLEWKFGQDASVGVSRKAGID